MSNSTNDMSERLLQYLDGELSAGEREQLEQQLATDAALQQELEGLKLAREAVRSYGLQQRVKDVHQEMMKEMQTPVRRLSSNRRILRYTMSAAAAILVIFLGITTYNYFTLSGEKLFSEYYRSFEMGNVRGPESASPIVNAYRDKKYRAVVTITSIAPFTIQESFLRGMAYNELGETENAINSYKEVMAKNESAGTHTLQDETQYYLALTYLRNKQYAEALSLMEKIQDDPANPYHERITPGLIRKVKRLT